MVTVIRKVIIRGWCHSREGDCSRVPDCPMVSDCPKMGIMPVLEIMTVQGILAVVTAQGLTLLDYV